MMTEDGISVPKHVGVDIRSVCKMFDEWYQKTQNGIYKHINFIGLQNNHPSQHTVGIIHKVSGNCRQMTLWESIAEPLSHFLG